MRLHRRQLTIIAAILVFSVYGFSEAMSFDKTNILHQAMNESDLGPVRMLSAIREFDSKTMLYGVDVSQWDGTIDWDALKSSVDFVIMRSSYGQTGLDTTFSRNQSEARRVGIPMGYYHYSYPEYNDPEPEADHFVATVGTLQPGEILCLDFEENTTKDIVDWSARFMNEVYAQTSVKPFLYINRSTQSSVNWSNVIGDDYGLWLAAWDGLTNFTSNVTQWPSITLKQYSAAGTASGVPVSEVDMDIFNGTVTQFRDYGLQALPPSLSITSPTTGLSYPTDSGSLSISGTAADNVSISGITWTNNRGGSGTCTSSGSNSWSASAIALQPGNNVITVSATNSVGVAVSRRLNAFYSTASQNILLAGLSGGSILYSYDLSKWNQIPGVLSQAIVGDFDGDGRYGIAGVAPDNTIWYTTDKANWTKIPGFLTYTTAGDFNGDGKDDIAGIASDGSIWYTTDKATWTKVPGYLSTMAAGDFTGSGVDGLAGLASDGTIWYTANLKTWKQIPGHLAQIAVGDLNGDGIDDIAGISSDSQIWYTTDLQNWTNIPGQLKGITIGDFTASGSDRIAGISSDGLVWETPDLKSWSNIPGRLDKITSADLNTDGKSDIVGFSSDGGIWYSTDLQNWAKLPAGPSQLSTSGR
jgi:GH25 family lysozyme M1 (1,4-beta-N-acetylmuramidase)